MVISYNLKISDLSLFEFEKVLTSPDWHPFQDDNTINANLSAIMEGARNSVAQNQNWFERGLKFFNDLFEGEESTIFKNSEYTFEKILNKYKSLSQETTQEIKSHITNFESGSFTSDREDIEKLYMIYTEYDNSTEINDKISDLLVSKGQEYFEKTTLSSEESIVKWLEIQKNTND